MVEGLEGAMKNVTDIVTAEAAWFGAARRNLLIRFATSSSGSLCKG